MQEAALVTLNSINIIKLDKGQDTKTLSKGETKQKQ